MHPGALVVGADIGHAAGDGDAGFGGVGEDFGEGILADDADFEAGDLGADVVVDFGEVPAEGIDIGGVIHGAAEEEGRLGGAFLPEQAGFEKGEIDPIGDDLKRDGAADVAADEGLVVGAAEDLHVGAAGDAFFVEPEFGDVFPGEEFVFETRGVESGLLKLVLQVHAAAVDGEGDVAMLAEEVLGEDDVANVNEVVAVGGELLADGVGELGEVPVADGGGGEAEKAAGKEAGPGGVLEGDELDAAAEGLEDGELVETLAVFAEGDEVHGVLAGELAQEVESALICTAIERVGDVRIDNEDVHDVREELGINTRAGMPAATTFGGMSRVTTAETPMTERVPMRTAPTALAPSPMKTPSSRWGPWGRPWERTRRTSA